MKRFTRITLTTLTILIITLSGTAAADDQANANKRFLEAHALINRANVAYLGHDDPLHFLDGLPKAIKLLESIVTDFPGSDLAIKIATGMPIGDMPTIDDLRRVYRRNRNSVIYDYCYQQETLAPPHCEGEYRPYIARRIDDSDYDTVQAEVLALTDTTEKDGSIEGLIATYLRKLGNPTDQQRHEKLLALLPHVTDTTPILGRLGSAAKWMAENNRNADAYAIADRHSDPQLAADTIKSLELAIARRHRRISDREQRHHTLPQDYIAAAELMRSDDVRFRMVIHFFDSWAYSKILKKPDVTGILALVTNDQAHDEIALPFAVKASRYSLYTYAFDIADLARDQAAAEITRQEILLTMLERKQYKEMRAQAPRLNDRETAQAILATIPE